MIRLPLVVLTLPSAFGLARRGFREAFDHSIQAILTRHRRRH